MIFILSYIIIPPLMTDTYHAYYANDTPDTNHANNVNNANDAYTPSLEYFLQRKGEECEAWSKLHLMSHKKFKKRETMYNLPIITITAFIGFVSGLNLDYEHIHLILGGMSLYASLLKSYFSYLKISQKSENHRIAYIQYGQIANEIRVELALEPNMRKSTSGLIDLIRIKMKNLLEVSEIVDNSTIDEYLSQLAKTNQTNVLHWFTRERNGIHTKDKDNANTIVDDALGRPHVLKLANRVESYVDIENKVMRLPNAGRSMSSPQSPQPQSPQSPQPQSPPSPQPQSPQPQSPPSPPNQLRRTKHQRIRPPCTQAGFASDYYSTDTNDGSIDTNNSKYGGMLL